MEEGSGARARQRRFGGAITLLYFFSGVAAVAYQVLWARMLSLQFGVSIFGVVVTAAAFMVGLGLGSLHGRRSAALSSPLRRFALLEGGVALYALLLPFLLMAVERGIDQAAGLSLYGWYLLFGLAALVMVALPAWAMGFAFPMVLRALEGSEVPLSRIYGVNTLGGALGALLPLLLLPLLGWTAALWSVALLGLAVALVAWRLNGNGEVRRAPEAPSSVAPPAVALIAYGAVGMGALMLEIGWSRLFGMLLLRTEYVMAVILAVFLVGIGLGSVLARHMRARWWFDLLPLAAAGFALAGLWAIPALGSWAEASEFSSLGAVIVAQGAAVALLTLPVTLLLGAWLPLLNRHLGLDKSGGALLYGANSVGGALGALVAGLVLIPWLGTHGAVVVAALILFLAGMVWASRRTWYALPLLGLLAAPVALLPPVAKLLPESQAGSRDLMVHEDALAITHVVERPDGQRLLLADLQRMDASSEPLAVVSQKNQVRLPLLLHPEPRSVLFLGLGTGISASASLPFPELERTAVELSQGAIDAACHWFRPVNGGVTDRIELVRDDARRFLRASTGRFDVIIGDLFHPDFIGRSALLSVQQFRRAREHLNDGGIFVQWLATNQFDPRTLQVVLRSFERVFPDGVLFVDGFRLALVGSAGAPPVAASLLASLERLDEEGRAEATGGEGPWSWLGRYWGGVAAGPGPVQDEWAPVIEYRLPRVRYGGGIDLARMERWLLERRPTLREAARALAIPAEAREAFERAFIATDLGHRAWLAQFEGHEGEAQRLMRLAFQANPSDRWIASAIADRMFASLDAIVASGGLDRQQALERILKIDPRHVETLRALWRLARERGDGAGAARYRRLLEEVVPLDRTLVGQ